MEEILRDMMMNIMSSQNGLRLEMGLNMVMVH